MRSAQRVLFLSLALLAVVGVTSLSVIMARSEPAACPIALPRQELGRASLTNSYTPYDCVSLETTKTPAALQTGLSGRAQLPPNQGMLFDFGESQTACIWMKDMNFNIDIVWLNQSEEIIKILEDVSPNTYPESFCADNTAYVVELAAGVARQAGLRVGQQLKI